MQSTPERFWGLVDRQGENDCWPWTGGVNYDGYGQIMFARKSKRAHRVAYELLVGPIPEESTLDHLCRNRRCCNPRHLEPVTIGENVKRGVGPSAVNTNKTHCVNGHPLTGDNLCVRYDGARRCKVCRRDWFRAKRAKVKAMRLSSELPVGDANG